MIVPVPLPNSTAGRTSETIGFFRSPVEHFESWLTPELGGGFVSREVRPTELKTLMHELASRPGEPLSQYLLIGLEDWTAILTNGPLGTDPGLIPSRAARDLGITAIRASVVESESDSYDSRVIEFFDPHSDDPQIAARVVYAVDEGGSWRFAQLGEPFDFEDLAALAARSIRNRFSVDDVHNYLRELGVPVLTESSEVAGFVVER